MPCGPINDLAAVFSDPQVLARRMVETVDHPTIGPVRVTGVPYKLAATPGSVRTPPPLLGEHTDEVLAWLGYDATTAARRRRSSGCVTCGACDLTDRDVVSDAALAVRPPTQAVHDRPAEADLRHGLGDDPVEVGRRQAVERVEEVGRLLDRVAAEGQRLDRDVGPAAGLRRPAPGIVGGQQAEPLTRRGPTPSDGRSGQRRSRRVVAGRQRRPGA